MTIHVRAEHLALYAFGDLPAADAGAVADHVNSCSECQNELAEFRDTQAFITASLRDPALEDLTIVRERLRSDLYGRRDRETGWAWWLAGAAAVVGLLVVVFAFNDRTTVPQRARPAIAHATSTGTAPIKRRAETAHVFNSAMVRKVRRDRDRGIRAVTLIARTDQPPIIRMTTVDPTVVILWESHAKVEHE